MYGGLNHGRIDVGRLRTVLVGLPLPRFDGGRLVLAVDVSPWLRSDAPCSAERLFCHVYGRAKTASQFIPGWPYSFVAVLEPGATSWTAILDAVRLGPADDATAVTAAQLREVVERLIAAGQWQAGNPGVGDVDADVDKGRGQAFGEVFEQVGGLGAGGGAGVEAVDFVDEDELDTSGGVGGIGRHRTAPPGRGSHRC